MKNNKSSLVKVTALVLTLGLLGVSEASFANWERNCRVHFVNGVRVQTCNRVYREGWNDHRRWDHRRFCRTWYDRFGRFHRSCEIR